MDADLGDGRVESRGIRGSKIDVIEELLASGVYCPSTKLIQPYLEGGGFRQ